MWKQISEYGWWGGPQFGWDFRTWILQFFYVFRSCTANYCVKQFNAVVKNICNALAPLMVYVLQVTILHEKVADLTKLVLIVVVVLDVTNYTIAGNYARKSVEAKASEKVK